MGEFFNLDNKFFQGLNKLIDCFGLSILWLICCIPVITAGAATTAFYYTVNKVIRHGRGYVGREFWHALRVNFKQSTLSWLLVLLLYIILGMDCYVMYQVAQSGSKLGILYIVFIVLMALVTMWGIYLFAYIARFENTTKQVLKNAALIAVGNLPKTLLLFILFVAVCFLIYLLPILIIVLPTIYMLLENFILEKTFRKYMSEEDIAAEDERNSEFFN